MFETFEKLFSKKKKTWRNAQEYINKRKEVKELLLQNHRLKGLLSLRGFVDVEVINCRHNRITNLDLSDCKSLRRLYCDDNQRIKNLDLSNLKKLEWLDCCNNRFSDLNFLNTIPNPKNLQGLVICNNPFFSPLNSKNFSRFSNLKLLLKNKHN